MIDLKGPLVIYFYNLFMLTALWVLCPIWIPLVVLQKKRRNTFMKRVLMEALPARGNGSPFIAGTHRIWIHALSVGEVLSAEPLVKALGREYGRAQLIFSASTQTGFEMATRVISPHVAALRHFPYDTLFSVNRALDVIKPRQVVIVETDIWPNFLYRLSQRRIPVHLVNARLSDRSFNGYQRIGFLMAPLLSVFGRICAQTDSDRLRFIALGVPEEKVVTAGNIKFDQAPVSIRPDDLNQLATQFKLAADSPIWVAGSTHEGEETVLVGAYRKICASGIQPVLIVAPRDPSRAIDVCKIFKRSGIDAVTMDRIERRSSPSRVIVIDRIGILRNLYALADVAFVGGSLVNAAGHNPLEPASVAKPILFGPHTDDFRWICQSLEIAGGAIRVANSDQLADAVCQLIVNKKKSLQVGRCAHAVFSRNRGAVQRTLAAIGI